MKPINGIEREINAHLDREDALDAQDSFINQWVEDAHEKRDENTCLTSAIWSLCNDPAKSDKFEDAIALAIQEKEYDDIDSLRDLIDNELRIEAEKAWEERNAP